MFDDLADEISPYRDHSYNAFGLPDELTESISAAKLELASYLPEPPLPSLIQKMDTEDIRESPFHLVTFSNDLTVHEHLKYDDLNTLMKDIEMKGEKFLQEGQNIAVIVDNLHPLRTELDPQIMFESRDVGAVLSEQSLPVELITISGENGLYLSEFYNQVEDITPQIESNVPQTPLPLPEITHKAIEQLETLHQEGTMDVATMAELLSLKYAVHTHEELGLIFVKDNHILTYAVTRVGTENEVKMPGDEKINYIHWIKDRVEEYNCNQVIEFHNHPFGETLPSMGDVKADLDMRRLFGEDERLKVVSFDSLIVSPYNAPFFFNQHPFVTEHFEEHLFDEL